VIPAEVPSNWRAAARLAESTYAWASFLAIYMRPMSRANPETPRRNVRLRQVATRMYPREPAALEFDDFIVFAGRRTATRSRVPSRLD
jgi:hypothetical protein